MVSEIREEITAVFLEIDVNGDGTVPWHRSFDEIEVDGGQCNAKHATLALCLLQTRWSCRVSLR